MAGRLQRGVERISAGACVCTQKIRREVKEVSLLDPLSAATEGARRLLSTIAGTVHVPLTLLLTLSVVPLQSRSSGRESRARRPAMSSGDWGDSEPEDQPPCKCRTPDSWWEPSEGDRRHELKKPESPSRDSERAMAMRRPSNDPSGCGNSNSLPEMPDNSQQSEGNSDSTASLTPSGKRSPEDDANKGGGKPPAGKKTSPASKQTRMTDFYPWQGEPRKGQRSIDQSQVQVEAGPAATEDQSSSDSMNKTPQSEESDSENGAGTAGKIVPPEERTQADSECEAMHTQPVADNKGHASGAPSNAPVDRSRSESNRHFTANDSTTEPGMQTVVKQIKPNYHTGVDSKSSKPTDTHHAKCQEQRKDAGGHSRNPPPSSNAMAWSPGPMGAGSWSQKSSTDTGGGFAGKSDPIGQVGDWGMKSKKDSQWSGSRRTTEQPRGRDENDKEQRKDAGGLSRSPPPSSNAMAGSSGLMGAGSWSQKSSTDTRSAFAGKSEPPGQVSKWDMSKKDSPLSGSCEAPEQPRGRDRNDKDHRNDTRYENKNTFSPTESPTKINSVTSPTHSGAGGHRIFDDGVQPGVSHITPLVALPELRPSPTHVVTATFDGLDGIKVTPPPDQLMDKWDSDHVRMPYSFLSLHQAHGPKEPQRRRWNLIEETLLRDFKSSYDIETAIKSYNPKYAHQWDFEGLHAFFRKDQRAPQLLQIVIPKMACLALQLPTLCTQSLPLLRQHSGMMVTMSQEQAACLLANAFFCTFPRRNASGLRSEYADFPAINFNRLFEGVSSRKLEKLRAIFNYFSKVCEKMPKGLLTFHRKKLEYKVDWQGSTAPLTKLEVKSNGTIENEGRDMLQVDFANKFVGGGVLGNGLVQEEIRFIINPELIVSRLFTEVLGPFECLIVTGTERFSDYTGYGDTFKCGRAIEDNTPRDGWMRRRTEIVAIDAIHFYSYTEQFEPRKLERELNKAFCGFSCAYGDPKPPAVATGNWGCGAFGGDKQLKALLQALAAAQARRKIVYFTFGDSKLETDFRDIHNFLTLQNYTVGAIIHKLMGFHSVLSASPHGAKPQLYEWLMQMLHK